MRAEKCDGWFDVAYAGLFVLFTIRFFNTPSFVNFIGFNVNKLKLQANSVNMLVEIAKAVEYWVEMPVLFISK